ncbi:hypothetical protein HBI81_097590 [Parastagonospora nodorum]|nr:hypothetical protein HBH52_131010 [Parastagonospora nodorum]KAH4066677.1 hypothetical protein HBH50_141650 [Parastagonospora nodorum]KAH4086262.1 hypothetical protein HBH48_148340 [Parastagonospora nodorum]KAH4169913.1 hypothetical protein HBH43_112460 [Parastagonospora nodorum]KAH4189117.1 hypothetical protein HBH42_139550 [Parastagonospora nodorum]
MFKLSMRAACLGIKQTHHVPAFHIKLSSTAQGLSTDSAPTCSRFVKQVADQFQKTQVLRTDGASGLSPMNQVAAKKVTRTEQLVWLARLSLASSSMEQTRDITFTSTARSDKDMTVHRDREIATSVSTDCTKSWDGPTVWAHLW